MLQTVFTINPCAADPVKALHFAILISPTIFNFWHSTALVLSPDHLQIRKLAFDQKDTSETRSARRQQQTRTDTRQSWSTVSKAERRYRRTSATNRVRGQTSVPTVLYPPISANCMTELQRITVEFSSGNSAATELRFP